MHLEGHIEAHYAPLWEVALVGIEGIVDTVVVPRHRGRVEVTGLVEEAVEQELHSKYLEVVL
jgi:hypothetical protein